MDKLAFENNDRALLELSDLFRIDANRKIDSKTRSDFGQFMTPAPVAAFMSSLFRNFSSDEIRLFDPGAGIGILSSAFINRLITLENHPNNLSLDLYELESAIVNYLTTTQKECIKSCRENNIKLTSKIIQDDFIKLAVEIIKNRSDLFTSGEVQKYTHCIINPPYRKIRSDSVYRQLLEQVNLETSNLYSGFVSLAVQLLEDGGEIVAIVPRSFCNGPYFKSFRKFLLANTAITHIHVFNSRNKTFNDDKVLQENIIFHAIRGEQTAKTTITSSMGPDFSEMTYREVDFAQLVKPNDPEKFIHLTISDFDKSVEDHLSNFQNSLPQLKLGVSTGPVVDFRLRSEIQLNPDHDTFPLIYPTHFTENYVEWPKLNGKKPNSINNSENSKRWLLDKNWYVLTKRFSSKEERRRIVAALYDPNRITSEKVGFENHLNVFHSINSEFDPILAKGLAVYLNSTLLDLYFRQFSGHTQVNATDLRTLTYPSSDSLMAMGNKVGEVFPSQEEVDHILDMEINKMSAKSKLSPLKIKRKINQALDIIISLGFPREQQNERSAITLLALLGIKPKDDWTEAKDPLIGITPIMDYCKEYYGKQYAPNTRETFRRQTMHQFVDAGIVILNPDDTERPVNSPKSVYQIEPNTLTLIKNYSNSKWKVALEEHLKVLNTLAERYAKERKMKMIPLSFNKDEEISLSPGNHSQLIKEIIENLGPRFFPGSQVLYIGDTGSKMAFFDEGKFDELGLKLDTHGKFPDVVLFDLNNNWIILIESVTSHGPVDSKRHGELSEIFKDSSIELIFITAFPDRMIMAKHLSSISWETEVWIADSPTHLIHFDGDRFLGPYDK
ncbi:MAG: BsuBI/PstI family type II restriction endonuclease [Candidatus Electryonea clarkiae]|nr:BsuBI/PstI family type II restriction endonuclease [Candidatus Electryonea clarkiae]MDP8285791.1 BsuBI/PstI family type II restriction endonuclease [Candidatus Electryonea clarkiae]